MTKNDFDLFYNTLIELDISLPNIESISIIDERVNLYNLSPKEIFYAMYIDGKALNGKIAKYWDHDYHLDTNYTISKLIEDKYITTQDYQYNIQKSTKNDNSIKINVE